MNQGVMQSSPVQQLVAAGGPTWWSINNMRAPPPILHHHQHSFLAAPPHQHHNQPPIHQLASPLSGWNEISQLEELPESWSQLLSGGLVGEDDKAAGGLSHDNIHQAKKFETWEQQFMNQNSSGPDDHHRVIKQENPAIFYSTTVGNSVELFQLGVNKPTNSWSPHHHHHQIMSSASSPKSSVTTKGTNSNMMDFSHKSISDHGSHPKQEYTVSSECNSTATGGAAKKARINQPSSAQSTFKVRKERLGDRITALHQIVSPFGKTDTASVLLEAIGYIRFLQNQIEALSLPYLGNATSANTKHQQRAARSERNCLFPEDPGQLLNEKCNKRKGISDMGSDEEPKKDLKSRGLCLVPISCTLNVGTEINGADYWAPAFAAANFR